MRIDMSKVPRRRSKWEWHLWFAWYPIRIYSHVVWLEFVNRRRRLEYGEYWEYKFPEDAWSLLGGKI